MTAKKLTVVLALCLVGCSDSESQRDAGPDAALDGAADVGPEVAPDAAVDAGAATVGWPEPTPPACPGAQTGTGAVWSDDPADLTLVERPLHCLAGDGRLHGPLVAEIETEGWEPAEQAENAFVYAFDDDRFNEVQAYYIIVGMAGYLAPFYQPEEIAAAKVSLSKTAHMASAMISGGVIQAGMAGGLPPVVSLQLLSHEYGHHLVAQFTSEIDIVLNEAIADYLAADYTGNPEILSLDRVDVPDSIRQIPQLMSAAAEYFERSVQNDLHYPEDMRTHADLCQFQKQAAAQLPPDSALILADKLERCEQMSEEEMAMPEPHLTGRIVAGALWDLRSKLGSATVNHLVFEALKMADAALEDFRRFEEVLIAADDWHNYSANEAAIREVVAARGLSGGTMPDGDAGPTDAGTDLGDPYGSVKGTISVGGSVSCGSAAADDCQGLLMVVAADVPQPPPASTIVGVAIMPAVDLSGGNTAAYEIVDLPAGITVWVTAALSEDGSDLSAGPKSGDVVTDVWAPSQGLTIAGSAATLDLTLDARYP